MSSNEYMTALSLANTCKVTHESYEVPYLISD